MAPLSRFMKAEMDAINFGGARPAGGDPAYTEKLARHYALRDSPLMASRSRMHQHRRAEQADHQQNCQTNRDQNLTIGHLKPVGSVHCHCVERSG